MATLHPDYKPKHLPTYAQAAGSSKSIRPKKGKQASVSEVSRKVVDFLKMVSSLPYVSRRSLGICSSPSPHPQAQLITKAITDIVATTLTESNWLLPKAFVAKVNDGDAVSLTRTDPQTLARSNALYFDTITRRLNPSYSTGSSPWLAFNLAPTAIQLAVHSVPTDILPANADQLYSSLKRAIQNAKRDPNQSGQVP